MKRYCSIRQFITLLAAGALFLGVASVSAQGQGRGRGALQNATEEERALIQEINQATREFQAQLREANQALGAAIFAEKVDEAAIKEKAAAVAKIQAEMAVARAKAFNKVRGKLSKEIIDALKANPLGAGGGGRGRGRGANN